MYDEVIYHERLEMIGTIEGMDFEGGVVLIRVSDDRVIMVDERDWIYNNEWIKVGEL